MPVGADSGIQLLASGFKISIGGGSGLRPMMWMFLAILVTFLITRTVTRLIVQAAGPTPGWATSGSLVITFITRFSAY